MARQFVINGETLVSVWILDPTVNDPTTYVMAELGLAEKNVTIIPKYYHKDINVDDFGPNVPADVLAMIAECQIGMTLVNFDTEVLNKCLSESIGGGTAGTMPGAGIPMGATKPLYTKGNHYIGLYLQSPILEQPWYFPATYMPNPPMEFPIGTEKTLVKLTWRAIPYVVPDPNTNSLSTGGPTSLVINTFGDVQSSGAILWQRSFTNQLSNTR